MILLQIKQTHKVIRTSIKLLCRSRSHLAFTRSETNNLTHNNHTAKYHPFGSYNVRLDRCALTRDCGEPTTENNLLLVLGCVMSS